MNAAEINSRNVNEWRVNDFGAVADDYARRTIDYGDRENDYGNREKYFGCVVVLVCAAISARFIGVLCKQKAETV